MYWYEFDKSRVVLECQKMQDKFPKFILSKYERKLAWEGEVNAIPEGVEAVPLRIRLIYSDAFPIVPPKVYPIEPELPKDDWGHQWHRWQAGNLCYIEPTLWHMNYTAVDIIEKIEIWYFNFLAYKFGKIDMMPDTGMANIPIEGGV